MTVPHPALAALDAAIEDAALPFGDRELSVDRLRAARDLVTAAVTDSGERCESCEHGRAHHASDTSECWFTVASGKADVAVGCACAAFIAPSVGVDDTTTQAREDDERIKESDLGALREAGTIVFCDVVNRSIPGVVSTWSYGFGPRNDQTMVTVRVDEHITVDVLAKNVYLPAPTSGAADTGRDAGEMPQPSRTRRPSEETEPIRCEECGAVRCRCDRARVDFLAAQFVPYWAHLAEEARDGVRPGIARFLQALDGVR